MRPLRSAWLGLALACAAVPAGVLVTSDARASVSVAVTLEGLLQETTLAVVGTPSEASSVWENGRIYTYTRVHVDRLVAGDGTRADGSAKTSDASADVWIRTMGGIVGKIGQRVDGEAVLVPGRPSLFFLHAGPTGSYEVTARAQGQYPIIRDPQNQPRVIKSNSAGALLQPHAVALARAHAIVGAVGPVALPLLAADAIHDRPLEEALRDIAAAWKRVHGA
jgi:hypothetical protein